MSKVKIETHNVANSKVAEIVTDEIIIASVEKGLDLMIDLYYQEFDKIVIHESNMTPAFFDLKNGMAGELLQKFSNYRMRFTIVGDFSKYTGKSITEFISESNRGRQINFVGTRLEAIKD